MFTGKLGLGQLGAYQLGGIEDAGGNVINRVAESNIALDHDGTRQAILSPLAESALTLDHTAAFIEPIVVDASSALTLNHATALAGTLPVFATSELVLTDETRLAGTFDDDATSSLTITDIATYGGTLTRFATSTLTVAQFLDLDIKEREALSGEGDLFLDHSATFELIKKLSSQLILSDSARSSIIAVGATSALVLDHVAHQSIRLLSVDSPLELDQVADASIKPRIVVEAELAIALDHVLQVNRPWYVSATDALVTTEEVFDIDLLDFVTVITGLDSSASVIVNRPQTASNVLPLTDSANRQHIKAGSIALGAESVLVLDDAVLTHPDTDAVDNLELDHSAEVQNSTPAESELELDQLLSFTLDRSPTSANAIGLGQSVSFVLEGGSLCNYSPFIGEGSGPTPPPATLPAASELTGFRLLFPSMGVATDELILRAPNLGNIDRLAMTRINRETRGGTLIVFADPIWPKVQTLVLNFSVLKREEAQGLLTFMLAHLGQEIRLIDWEHRGWKGVIMNPQDPIVEDRKNSFSASFEFEGARE